MRKQNTLEVVRYKGDDGEEEKEEDEAEEQDEEDEEGETLLPETHEMILEGAGADLDLDELVIDEIDRLGKEIGMLPDVRI